MVLKQHDRIGTDVTHRQADWIEGTSQGSQYGSFLETTRGICNGIRTCLQLAYPSAIEREANASTGAPKQTGKILKQQQKRRDKLLGRGAW